MTRNGCLPTSSGIGIQVVTAPMTFEVTPCPYQLSDQFVSFHTSTSSVLVRTPSREGSTAVSIINR